MLDKTIKEAYLTDVALSNSHNPHSTITQMLQKYTDLKDGFVTLWLLTTPCIMSLVLSTWGVILSKLHDSLYLLDRLKPKTYIMYRQL